jgi:hypothetical protein
MMRVVDKNDEARDQALYTADSAGSIPRISHGEQLQAASAGIWLHSPDMSQGRHSVPELVFFVVAGVVVAGVGFEPT